MLKKIFVLLFLSVFLFSCGNEEVSTIGTTDFENEDFSLKIPSSWNVLNNNDKVLPSPSYGTIGLAASSSEIRYGFANNILVLKQELSSKANSKEFSILNNIGANKEYLSYLKLDTKEISYIDEDKSNLYIFEAKYNEKTPKLKFLQTAKVCGKNAYLITISLSIDIKETEKYESLLSSFNCK